MKNIRDILLEECNTIEDYAVRREFYGYLNSPVEPEGEYERTNPDDYYCCHGEGDFPTHKEYPMDKILYDDEDIAYLEIGLEYFDIYD